MLYRTLVPALCRTCLRADLTSHAGVAHPDAHSEDVVRRVAFGKFAARSLGEFRLVVAGGLVAVVAVGNEHATTTRDGRAALERTANEA